LCWTGNIYDTHLNDARRALYCYKRALMINQKKPIEEQKTEAMEKRAQAEAKLHRTTYAIPCKFV
jgi:hypothetical protein